MNVVEQRLAILESKVDAALAIDSRFGVLETDVKQLKNPQPRSLINWLTALGPFASSVALLLIGYWINDSVKAALAQEQLDLDYVKDMRDVMKDFNQSTAQPEAEANAMALAMYGKRAVQPLTAGLERGDVSHLAAEKGLLLIVSNDPSATCPEFAAILGDTARRYSWQTHKSVLKILSQSRCTTLLRDVTAYKDRVELAGKNQNRLQQLAARYSDAATFDDESATSLYQEAVGAESQLRQTSVRP